jgi:hypothetical protein
MRRITDEEPRTIREINPDIPEWLCQIIGRLMSKRPDDRFASAREVAELLEECLAHVQQPTVVPLPASLVTQSIGSPFFSISRRWLGVICIITLSGSALLGMVLWRMSAPPDIADRRTGEDGGAVVLKQAGNGQYTGAYTVSLEHQGAIKERPRLVFDRYLRTQTGQIEQQGPAGHGQARRGSGGGSGIRTFDRPNYAIALRLSPSPKGMQVFVDEATAIDSNGKEHNTVDSGKPFRMTVPAYEAVHPGCAGAYFAFDKTPAEITQLSGTLLLVPSQIYEARFSGKDLRENASRRTDAGTIRITSYREDDEGLSVSFSMPPLRTRRDRPKVGVVLFDSEGVPHLPRSETGGGGSFGGGVPTESRNYTFAALSESVKVDAIVIRIAKATGEPKRISFDFRQGRH